MSISPSANGAPVIDEDVCRACRRCVARSVCRTKAIRVIDPGEAPFVDGHLCMGCYECVPTCPSGAIVRPTLVHS
jgi:MinD superfamily P-loop ATPase